MYSVDHVIRLLPGADLEPRQHPRWSFLATTVDGYHLQTSCHKEPQLKPWRGPRSQLFIFDEVYQEAT